MKIYQNIIFLIFGFIIISFQNCSMKGFDVGDQPKTVDGSDLNDSQTNNDELEWIQDLFGTQDETYSSDNCNLLGQATLPLVTHYPQLGAKEQPIINNPNAGQQLNSGQEYVTYWDNSKFSPPTVGNYLGNNYDLQNYPPGVGDNAKRLEGRLKQLCISGLSSVRFIQGAHKIRSMGELSLLAIENAPYFQVLHSLVYKNNLFTIIIPPKWTKESSQSLPTLFNGLYDLNVNFMSIDGPPLLATLAQLFTVKKTSGFGILWNGNGALGSRSIDNVAYAELNEFLSIFLNDFGAAADKFVTFGGSRGGITALNVASHPAVTAIKVAFVYSTTPPNEFDTIAGLVTPTNPALLSAPDWSVGIYGSWRKSFRHPVGFMRTEFQGLTGSEAHLKVLTGTSRDSDVRKEFNALSPGKIDKLLRNRTQIFLEVGSHDFIVPSTDQFQLFMDGFSAGIQMEVRVNYLFGHGIDQKARSTKLASVMNTLIDQPPNDLTFVTPGQVNRFIASPDGVFNPLGSGAPPLTIELPRFVIDEADLVILATGPQNGRYLLVFSKGGELTKIEVLLDSNGLANLRLPQSTFSEGDHTFIGAYTLDSSSRPLLKVTITSLVKKDLVVTRFSGDIRPFLVNISGTIIDGISEKGRYFRSGIGEGSNYGFLQIGTSAIPDDELKLIGQQSSNLTCTYSLSSPGPIAVGNSITETLNCINVPADSKSRMVGTHNNVPYSDPPIAYAGGPVSVTYNNDGGAIVGVWNRRAEILDSNNVVIYSTSSRAVTLSP
ncbi:MAG: hypothetical protein H6625_09310 [Bdellovibrionaceae bacterium]|nr:hypothetical protein [Pseudobdellovibrionaceae bacterium]